MSGRKTHFLYALFILAATLLFLYIRFPADSIAEYISGSISGRHPDLHIDIKKVGPSIPAAVAFQSISLRHQEQPVFDAQSARVAPAIWSLLSDKKTFKFKIHTGDGVIKGQANLDSGKNDGQLTMRADIENIQLNDLSALKTYSPHAIWGVLSGKVDVAGLDANAQTEAKINVNGFKIQLDEPILNMESFEFKSINADISATPSRLQLKKCTFDGRDMDGELNGTISVRIPFENSILNFTGVIRPHPEFIARLSTTVPAALLSPGGIGKSGIPFRIRGTVSEPGFTMR